jgi:hypothetical protein
MQPNAQYSLTQRCDVYQVVICQFVAALDSARASGQEGNYAGRADVGLVSQSVVCIQALNI